MRKKDKDNRIKKNYNRNLSKEYGVEGLTKCPMQLFRKSRQTLVFNKFKTCLKNSNTRKVLYCSI